MPRSKLPSKVTTRDRDFDDLTVVLQEADLALSRVKSQLYSNSQMTADQLTSPSNMRQNFSTPYVGATATMKYKGLKDLLTQQEIIGSKAAGQIPLQRNEETHSLVMKMFERLESQAKTIEFLATTVRGLEEKNTSQSSEIKSLQDELSSIKASTLKDNEVEISNSQMWKQAIQRNVSELENRLVDLERANSNPTVVHLEKNVMGMKNECESLRMKIQRVTDSLGQLEMAQDNISFGLQRKELSQSHILKDIVSVQDNQRSHLSQIKRLNAQQSLHGNQLSTVSNAVEILQEQLCRRDALERLQQPQGGIKQPCDVGNRMMHAGRPSSNHKRITNNINPSRQDERFNGIKRGKVFQKAPKRNSSPVEFSTNYSDVATISDVDTAELLYSSASSLDEDD